ncbi:copper amine oxidase domain protein [Paenibacillus curdlanolyticus YK9]|uniref:Copper amine oxidase domain protein n=1 Tax=Paenibacillus curdlanolyticus YK9 TaxID=717606 RepID=E0I869_9BACL|nr:copper amine oxidase N-terminal domain-containing protein [Paenibacillus curdlanolyticus]EFM11374.1 copper amine oxidase domain protein [Paenibacillus curdlanolyticus YK9]
MKRIMVILLLFIIVRPAVSVSVAADELKHPSYSIVIDNEELKLDEKPFLRAGTTMIPMRAIFERLGLHAVWNAQTKQITASNDERKLVLTVGSRDAAVNGVKTSMPLAPAVINNVTYVPLRFVSDASGGNVEFYDGYDVVWVLSAKQDQLFSAIMFEDLKEVERLLAIGADPTVPIGPAGPEWFVFANGSIPLYELFLKYGMDINYYSQEWHGSTLLTSAITAGRPDAVAFLLEKGADPELTERNGFTPLELARYWQKQIEDGYTNIIDESLTPTVEDYDAIIRMLEEEIAAKK